MNARLLSYPDPEACIAYTFKYGDCAIFNLSNLCYYLEYLNDNFTLAVVMFELLQY